MAKIPQYVSNGGVSTQPSQNYIPAMGNDGSDLVGRAISGFGQNVQQAGSILAQQDRQRKDDAERQAEKDRIAGERAARLQKDNDELWAAKAAVNYKLNIAEQAAKLEIDMPENGIYADGSSFSDANQNLTTTLQKEAVDTAPNAAAAEFFKNKTAETVGDTYVKSLVSEAKERQRYSVKSFEEIIDVSTNLAIIQQDALPKIVTSFFESVNNNESMGPEQKRVILDKGKTALGATIIQRDLNEAATSVYPGKQILADIDSGAYLVKANKLGLIITPENMQAFRSKAEALTKTKDVEGLAILRSLKDDVIATAGVTGKHVDKDTMANFSALPVQEQNELIEKANLQADLKTGFDQIDIDPTGFAQKTLPKLANKTGPGAAKAAILYEALVKKAAAEMKYVQQQPGDASIKFAKTVATSPNGTVEKGMFTAIDRANTLNGELTVNSQTGQMDVQSDARYRLAWQASQGVSTAKQQVLGTTAAAAIVTELTNKNPLEVQGSLVKIQQGLQDIRNEYGPYAPMVMKELYDAGLSREHEVLALAGGTVLANKMTAALQVKSSVLEQNLGYDASKIRGTKENIKGLFKPYADALSIGAPNGERAGYINTLQEVVYRTALSEMSSDRTGKNITEVAEDVYKKLVTDQMSIQNGLIVPKVGANGKPQDINVVRGNLEAHQRYLTVDKIKGDYSSLGVNLPAPIRKKSELDAIKRDGYWVTNASGSGAYLAISNGGYNGVPVLGANGQRIEFSYKDLTDPKHKLPSNMNTRKQEQFNPIGDNVNSL